MFGRFSRFFLFKPNSLLKMEDFTKNGKKILGAALNYTDILSNPNVKKPEAPVMFLKPISSYITEGQDIVIPEVLTLVKHEVELGVIIGKKCKDVSVEEAHQYIGGYCLGLDLSAFCELNEARKNGFPWSMGKGFDTANPVSRFIALNEVKDLHNLDLYLNVNGVRRQTGNTKDLIYNSFELISYLSKYMTLEPCDLIMTGTPDGASQIRAGDVLQAGLSESGCEIVKMTFNVKS
ncbi:acylpyruvase FAHD1, mitochondrial [Contarinia nasturtii]|uniref:acylpyruvase FAHD1, mitochondrial n=1 Tax=Contarinia nasturtii TaxID=265458 RepID=UPI0012D4936A|nr:acylpyruvase FAHD1, mitochondrial [Contarinia nasturtii]XP_031636833.1 acylpyruvase FAHD1, mitochondrial [Contarinia nasturtii]